MFESLIDRFQILKRKLLGYGRITKTELDTILREIKILLLEADVHYLVVKEFITRLQKKANSAELSKSLTPGELVLKFVYEELVSLLGNVPHPLNLKGSETTILVLYGLQGVGKTTTAAKIAFKYKKKNPLLVPADAKRPAAVEQLIQMAKRNNLPVFPLQGNDPILTTKMAKEFAREEGSGILIVDTAGRLHIDDELIDELKEINRAINPDYRLLVVDGMAGQDAVNQAKGFKERVGLDGAILTKMDGDARGGAALSITYTTGVPIFFIGTGEYIDRIEEFYPDRIAQRILGMGDVAGLVEKVKTIEREVDHERFQKKIARGDLNLEDFMEQLRAVKRLGPLSKLAGMLPGIKESDVDEGEFKKVEAIINSMTKEERQHPEIIDGSRRRRIAEGSGTTVADVNRLLKEFFYARDLLKRMAKDKFPGKMPFRLK